MWTRTAIHLVARIEAGHGRAAADETREMVTLLRVAQAPSWNSDHMACWAAQRIDALRAEGRELPDEVALQVVLRIAKE